MYYKRGLNIFLKVKNEHKKQLLKVKTKEVLDSLGYYEILE